MSERETLDLDVVIVGGGPAGLAAAYHLRKLNKDLSIAVLEKGKEIGAHIISGAVMDPKGIDELMPDWKEKGAPVEKRVEEDHVLYLTKNRKFGLPIVPAPLQNHGNYIISLNKFIRWFGEQVEQSGVDIFAGFAGADLLIEGDTVVGVRTGDKGVDKRGNRKGNFEPGIDIRAKVTILAEGSRGSLTKQLVKKFALDRDRNPHPEQEAREQRDDDAQNGSRPACGLRRHRPTDHLERGVTTAEERPQTAQLSGHRGGLRGVPR